MGDLGRTGRQKSDTGIIALTCLSAGRAVIMGIKWVAEVITFCCARLVFTSLVRCNKTNASISSNQILAVEKPVEASSQNLKYGQIT